MADKKESPPQWLDYEHTGQTPLVERDLQRQPTHRAELQIQVKL